MTEQRNEIGEQIPERIEITHTHIGGQAVLEGVMMRGRYNWAVAVRTPEGEIHVEEHDLASHPGRRPWTQWPVVRGVVNLVDTMALAMKAFSISATLAGETEDEKLSEKEVGGVMIVGALIAVGLFMVLPHALTTWVVGPIQGTARFGTWQPFIWNVFDGLLRVIVLFGYIWVISRMQDIQRVFAYHGAEHKTIHAYEHGVDLEAPQIQRFGTAHVRCGTSFLLMVMIVALLVYIFVPVRVLLAGWGVHNAILASVIAFFIRLAFLPLIAGVAYEVIRYAGRHQTSSFVKVLMWPGMKLQSMTTREPDDSMVEVAVAAMKPIVEREAAEAASSPQTA